MSATQLRTAICTWFVVDRPEDATFFPQIGLMSDEPRAQLTYWKCVVCFFASSVIVNPNCLHLFFTNTDLPNIADFNVAEAFRHWNVKVIHLPVTFRLPRGSVHNWGNQFYIFDILKRIARDAGAHRFIILDSDCLFTRSVEGVEAAIDQYGTLTYTLGCDIYPAEAKINGLTRNEMSAFLLKIAGDIHKSVSYCGGEIVAASLDEIRRICTEFDQIWEIVVKEDNNSPREEAHLLSIIYAKNGYALGTANRFIKRMWTSFRHHTITHADVSLPIWHLPAEKKTGFVTLFDHINSRTRQHEDPKMLELNINLYKRTMGIPHRSASKYLNDILQKLGEKATSFGGENARR